MKKMKCKQKLNIEYLRALLHRSVQFYSPRPTPFNFKNASPDSSEVPPIMRLEAKKTPKEMKNNKALGIGNLTSDVMILEGEESVRQRTILKKSDRRDKKDTS